MLQLGAYCSFRCYLAAKISITHHILSKLAGKPTDGINLFELANDLSVAFCDCPRVAPDLLLRLT